MRFLHTSDLHIGVEVHGHSMLPDQEHIIGQILDIAKREKVDGIILAGDVYDAGTPRESAVRVLDDLVTRASGICPVYMTAGNHDSAERLSFGNKILQKQNLYISDAYSGSLERVVLSDEHGKLNLFMLPFIKPSMVRPFFPEEEIRTPDEALMHTIAASGVEPGERNVLIAHQFVTGNGISLSTTESEKSKFQVGGIDCISYDLLEPFDYVALGHIHRAQPVVRPTVRYSGSPLKYSMSEALDEKTVTIVDVKGKGDVGVRAVPLRPMRDMRKIKGTIAELTSPAVVAEGDREDYMYVILTESPMNAKAKLSATYPNIMELIFEEEHCFDPDSYETGAEAMRRMTTQELFGEFYSQRNPAPMSDFQKRTLAEAEDEARKEGSA
ncbi:MAG: exonuclease SbcCD subunit D [Methanomassiliicoccaceae archaeon]|nr:exonuclease SbcCD subunit D [Methanomassiliicoccaceae archaeon]